jgi:hypothetical protein
VCVPQQQCGPQNCGFGCCNGSVCLSGNSNNACGFGGAQCYDCTQVGDVCQGQQCVSKMTCNAQTCPFGCCQGNTCLPGNMDGACGVAGQQCQNCTSQGETCQNQQCMTACNPQNCFGCCDTSNVCQPGFLDTQCGGFGAPCQNCTALSPPSTCNGSVSPPVCNSQQTQCPSAYAGCPPGLSTQAQPVQQVCSASELQNAAAACASGAYSTSCFNFYNYEYSQNPPCGSCLQPFDVAFQDQTGLATCVAPFVSATCNQDTACTSDCTVSSCSSCPDQMTYDQCRAAVDASTGQCATWSNPATQCEQQAYSAAGSFCDPSKYSNFGTWLQGVGKYYCGK